MMEQRRGVRGGLRGVADRMHELEPVFNEALETVGSVLRRSGGLQRRRLLLGAILGGVEELLSNSVGVWERLTRDSERRRPGESIS